MADFGERDQRISAVPRDGDFGFDGDFVEHNILAPASLLILGAAFCAFLAAIYLSAATGCFIGPVMDVDGSGVEKCQRIFFNAD